MSVAVDLGPSATRPIRTVRAPKRPVTVTVRDARPALRTRTVHATVAALKGLERPEEVAARRGLPLEDVAPAALLRARAAGAGA